MSKDDGFSKFNSFNLQAASTRNNPISTEWNVKFVKCKMRNFDAFVC